MSHFKILVTNMSVHCPVVTGDRRKPSIHQLGKATAFKSHSAPSKDRCRTHVSHIVPAFLVCSEDRLPLSAITSYVAVVLRLSSFVWFLHAAGMSYLALGA